MATVIIPFPCILSEVFVGAEVASVADILRIRVKRGAFNAATRVAFGSAVEMISNSTDGSTTVNYIELTYSGSDDIGALRYRQPQVAGSAATGFLTTGTPAQPIVWKPGDHVYVAGHLSAAGSANRIQVVTTFGRLD
jgi:hypothetical protein